MNSCTIRWREPETISASVVITGDFCPKEENSDDVIARAEEITAGIKPVFESADLRIMQWETSIDETHEPIDKSGPNLRCKEGCLKIPELLGINVNLLANNHTGDYGPEALLQTIDLCRKHGFKTVGAGKDLEDAGKTLYLEVKGLKIALLNFCEHEFGFADEFTPGTATLDVIGNAQKIAEAKKQADVVIAALHGGHEYFSFPSPRIQQMCRFYADSGADIVFNCHMHCPAGYEIYHQKPLVYCPGNFYFPVRDTRLPIWYLGYLPTFRFDKSGAYELEITPYYNTKKAIVPLNKEDAESFFAYLQMLNGPLADPAKLRRYFDAWCINTGLGNYIGGIFGLPKPEDWNARETVQRFVHVRNDFICEAHRDLLANSFRLSETYRIKNAEKLLPEVLTFQHPGWMNHFELK